MRSLHRSLSISEVKWIAAFLVVCGVLVTVRLIAFTDDDASEGSEPPPVLPNIVAPVVPSSSPTGHLAKLWKDTPTAPADFADRNLVTPDDDVALSLRAADELDSWPGLGNETRLERVTDLLHACDVVDDAEPQCVVSPAEGVDPDKVAVLFGDTTMESYWYMLRAALQPEGWTIVNFSLSGCPAAVVMPVRPVTPERDAAECKQHHDAYAALLRRWQPSLVLVSDGEDQPYALLGDTLSSRTRKAALSAYGEGLARVLRLASAPGRRVIVLSPPPAQKSVASCQLEGLTPVQCQQAPYATWFTLHEIQREVTRLTRVTYANLLPYFCHELVCPSVVPKAGGTIAVRGDHLHMTPEYAQFLGASFSRYLSELRVIR